MQAWPVLESFYCGKELITNLSAVKVPSRQRDAVLELVCFHFFCLKPYSTRNPQTDHGGSGTNVSGPAPLLTYLDSRFVVRLMNRK
jgi:hypothetical protein